MKPPVLRVASASGAYLRARLGALTRAVAKASGACGVRTEIINGFILRAKKAAGRTTGVLIDPPSVLYVDCGIELTSGDSPQPICVSIPTGRDGLHSTYRALPVGFVADPTRIVLNPSQGISDGTAPRSTRYNLTRGNAPQVSRGGQVLFSHAHLQSLPSGDLTVENRVSATCVVEVEHQQPYLNAVAISPVVEGGDVYQLADDSGGPITVPTAAMSHYYRLIENAISGYLFMTKPVLTGSETPTQLTQIQDGFNAQAPMWVRTAVGAGDSAAGYTWFIATRLTQMASTRDFYGRNVLFVRRVFSQRVPEGISITRATLFSIDMATVGGLTAPVQVVPPDSEFIYTRYNAVLPLSMAYINSGELFCVTRMLTTRPAPVGAPVDEHTHPTVLAFRVDTATGSFVGSVTSIVAPVVDTPFYDHPAWYYTCAVGAASDGNEAVYLSLNLGIPDEQDSNVVSLGVVRYSAALGLETYTFTNPGFRRYLGVDRIADVSHPGWECANSKFENPDENCTDQLVYIGNRKYVFPCSSTSADWYGEFDFSVAVYNFATNTVAYLAEVESGFFNLQSTGADPTPLRAASLCCVQTELADEEGTITRPAVLLASIGDGRGSNLRDELTEYPGRGKTWISYDSGASWVHIANHGSGKSIAYGGSVTAPPPFGE